MQVVHEQILSFRIRIQPEDEQQTIEVLLFDRDGGAFSKSGDGFAEGVIFTWRQYFPGLFFYSLQKVVLGIAGGKQPGVETRVIFYIQTGTCPDRKRSGVS